jgi:hypothetical protein
MWQAWLMLLPRPWLFLAASLAVSLAASLVCLAHQPYLYQ